MQQIVSMAIQECGYTIQPKIDSFAGRTDLDIFGSIAVEPISDLQGLIQGYQKLLDTHLVAEDVEVIDGVIQTLEYLRKQQTPIGLLSGNFKVGAQIKLKNAQLEHYFDWSISAFGEDGHHRNELPPEAYKRALEHGYWKELLPCDVWIIGDTPRDIECAKAHGFHSVAVSTGFASYEALASHQPDILIRNLSDLLQWLNLA